MERVVPPRGTCPKRVSKRKDFRDSRKIDGEPSVCDAMLNNVQALLRDDEGATAVEYGLIVAAIAGVIIAVVLLLGKKLNNSFNNVQARI